jgi:hypothetical protein
VALTKPDIPVGTIKADALGTFNGVTWANVFYFAVGTSDPAHNQDVNDLVASAVHDFYSSGILLSAFPNTWTLDRVKLVYRDATDSHYKSVTVESATGSSAADLVPGQNALLINWTTNDPRKGGKPRTYVCGVHDDCLADSAHWRSDNLAAWQTQIRGWLSDIATMSHGTASDLELLEMSFRDGNTWRDSAVTWPVRDGAPNPVLCTQRRRTDRLLGG